MNINMPFIIIEYTGQWTRTLMKAMLMTKMIALGMAVMLLAAGRLMCLKMTDKMSVAGKY